MEKIKADLLKGKFIAIYDIFVKAVKSDVYDFIDDKEKIKSFIISNEFEYIGEDLWKYIRLKYNLPDLKTRFECTKELLYNVYHNSMLPLNLLIEDECCFNQKRKVKHCDEESIKDIKKIIKNYKNEDDKEAVKILRKGLWKKHFKKICNFLKKLKLIILKFYIAILGWLAIIVCGISIYISYQSSNIWLSNFATSISASMITVFLFSFINKRLRTAAERIYINKERLLIIINDTIKLFEEDKKKFFTNKDKSEFSECFFVFIDMDNSLNKLITQINNFDNLKIVTSINNIKAKEKEIFDFQKIIVRRDPEKSLKKEIELSNEEIKKMSFYIFELNIIYNNLKNDIFNIKAIYEEQNYKVENKIID